jgi:hypothetical protein
VRALNARQGIAFPHAIAPLFSAARDIVTVELAP